MIQITITGMDRTIAHLDNLKKNLPKVTQDIMLKTGEKAKKNLILEVNVRKKWNKWSERQLDLRDSFHVLNFRNRVEVRSYHPFVAAIDEGIPHRWKQPNQPIMKFRKKDGHPQNRPLNFIIPAFQKTANEMKKITKTEFKIEKMVG